MSLLQTAQQIQEAFCIRRGIPVARQFSDDELTQAAASVAQAERELYGQEIPFNELGCPLSPVEQALLDELNRAPLIPFRVTVTLPNRIEQISALAANSCDAAVQVIQLLFSDADECATTGFKVKVEPIQTRELRRAA